MYPESRRADVVEDLHGHKIADPYRWLEDPDSDETRDWVRRQNEFSSAVLAKLPAREWFHQAMSAIVSRPRAGVPAYKAGWYFVSRNDGTKAQDTLYVAESLEELLAGGRVLIDPNELSEDGTDSLSSYSVSDDGRYVVYGISESGSDWNRLQLVDLTTGDELDDKITETKFSAATWLPDSSSYLYLYYPTTGLAEGTDTSKLSGAQLKLHRVGTPQADDELVLEFPENPQLVMFPKVSDDDRYVVVHIAEGTAHSNRLWFYPITTVNGRSSLGEPVKTIDEPVAETTFVRMAGGRAILSTDLDAPRRRLVSCLITDGPVVFEQVVPEGESQLQFALGAGDGLVTVSLDDALPVVELHALDGSNSRRIDVAGGALVGINAKPGVDEVFVGLSSLTAPVEASVVSATTGEVRRLPELVPTTSTDFVPPEITVTRASAPSKDGTPVPYFLVTRADLDYAEPRPTLLYGYGGFKVPLVPDYRPGWSAWLAAGGVLVLANLRGGGEFGSEWYDAGRLDRKQNVFDDFIGVAEELQRTGVTTAAQLAIHGRSNGGLLVGAVMTQRPELFAAALPCVGVMDLLRFHKFTIGAAWASDYGRPDDEADFRTALAYSPLHNLEPGTSYPPTLVMTADHDDRVVPLHSHKFTAALQHAQAGDNPVIARIEVDAGHGMGKPLAMVASEWADLLAFAAGYTGLRPTEA
ncbi:prolyl oligopeptidase family serine peptidase [Kribbella deserti]|uniref:prolyl oligopeptidase n=1 Tax=Kribbella deserti TaxID=1926257 RepID=A0ABV6QKB4_9ACTN